MTYMLNMLQTKKLNKKYFVKINTFSFNLYIPKYSSKWVFRGKKMHFVRLSNAFKKSNAFPFPGTADPTLGH